MSKLALKAVRELRILFCQQSRSSAGVRDFVKANYAEMKKTNPTVPILIREASGTQPRITARFDKGVESTVNLENVDVGAVSSKLADLIAAAGK